MTLESTSTAAKASALSGGLTAIIGHLNINDLAVLVGIFVTLATFLTHLYFQHRRDARERRREHRELEVHIKTMGPNSEKKTDL